LKIVDETRAGKLTGREDRFDFTNLPLDWISVGAVVVTGLALGLVELRRHGIRWGDVVAAGRGPEEAGASPHLEVRGDGTHPTETGRGPEGR
jgi:hypothetical protein